MAVDKLLWPAVHGNARSSRLPYRRACEKLSRWRAGRAPVPSIAVESTRFSMCLDVLRSRFRSGAVFAPVGYPNRTLLSRRDVGKTRV
jgi:hypothetical protein